MPRPLVFVLKQIKRGCLGFFSWAILFYLTNAFAAWDFHDVSFLLPIQQETAFAELLGPEDQSERGPLLPFDKYKLIPNLIDRPTPERLFPILRVVAIRIDPCFKMHRACQKQLRLIWQPIRQGRAIDASVHTFYELSDAEFASLVGNLRQLKQQHEVPMGGRPLGIHPVMAAQGLQGAFWQDLKSIVLSYAGARNLIRMTFMTLRSPGNRWDFGGFDFAGELASALQIPRTAGTLQTIQNFSPTAAEFKGELLPRPQPESPLNDLLTESEILRGLMPAKTAKSALDELERIENPRLTTPADIDCVSCHAAQPAKHWLWRNYDLQAWASPFRFVSEMNLHNENGDASNTRLLRAFGYVRHRPLISQRVINESAEVAQQLQDLFQ
jgi:hypothetical protein